MTQAQPIEQPRPFISEPLTWEQICERYPDQWVCLVEIDEINHTDFDFRTARVVGHGKTRRESLDQADPWLAQYEEFGHYHTPGRSDAARSPLRKEVRPRLAGMAPIEASIAEVEGFDHPKIPVNLFGVANLKTFMATTSGLIREIFLVEFGDPDKDAAFLDSISPLRDADKIVDPLFVYAGANDPRVPRSESDLIVEALRTRKVPVEYMVAANEGHSLSHRENLIECCARAARFLETHLE